MSRKHLPRWRKCHAQAPQHCLSPKCNMTRIIFVCAIPRDKKDPEQPDVLGEITCCGWGTPKRLIGRESKLGYLERLLPRRISLIDTAHPCRPFLYVIGILDTTLRCVGEGASKYYRRLYSLIIVAQVGNGPKRRLRRP